MYFHHFHIKLTYKLIYDKGFFCKTIECKSKISLDILGIDYDSKKFEKIGSKSEYLSKLYKTDIISAKNMKYSPKSEEKKFNNKLEDFQRKYGELEGKYRYNKRLEGIIKNNKRNKFPCTLENFINKYGIEWSGGNNNSILGNNFSDLHFPIYLLGVYNGQMDNLLVKSIVLSII